MEFGSEVPAFGRERNRDIHHSDNLRFREGKCLYSTLIFSVVFFINFCERGEKRRVTGPHAPAHEPKSCV